MAGNNSIWGRVYDVNGIASNINANGGGLGAKTGLYGVVNDNHAQRTMIYFSNTSSNMKQRIQNRDHTWAITNNSGDFGLVDGMRIRRLTPLECERLQGFPDNWTKYGADGEEISDTQRYRMCGNAVTVPVVEYLARKLE